MDEYRSRLQFVFKQFCELKQGICLADNSGSGKLITALKLVAHIINDLPLTDEFIEINKLQSKKDVYLASKFDISKVSETISQILARNVDKKDLEKCNLEWQDTKFSWLHLKPNEKVPYTESSVAAYACGTTILHAVLFKYVMLNSLSRPITSNDRILVLCGGSGAEVVGLNLLIKDSTDWPTIDVVDLHREWKSTLDACGEILLESEKSKKLKYHLIDLLVDHERLTPLIEQATIVTMMYGFTELHDANRDAAGKCIEHILDHLASESILVITDPLKLNFGKSEWLEHVGERRRCQVATNQFKVKMDPEIIENVSIFDWIKKMNLKLNEDIKLSAHVWSTTIRGPRVESSDVNETTDTRMSAGVVICASTHVVTYVIEWLQSMGIRHTVSLGKLSGAEPPAITSAALWHVESALLNFRRAIVVIHYGQLELLGRSDALVKLTGSSDIAVLDDFDKVLAFRNWESIENRLESILPSKNKRVIVGKYQGIVKGLSMISGSLYISPKVSNLSLSSLDEITKECAVLTDVKLSFCFDSGCHVEPESRVVVRFDSSKNPNVLSFKQLHSMAGPLDDKITDLVFETHQEFSSKRVMEIANITVCKLCHIFKPQDRCTMHFHCQMD